MAHHGTGTIHLSVDEWNEMQTHTRILRAEVATLAEANRRLNEDNDKLGADVERRTESGRRMEIACNRRVEERDAMLVERNAARTTMEAYKATDEGLRAQVDELAGALKMLVDQIERNDFVDSLGHKAAQLHALAVAQQTLTKVDKDGGE